MNDQDTIYALQKEKQRIERTRINAGILMSVSKRKNRTPPPIKLGPDGHPVLTLVGHTSNVPEKSAEVINLFTRKRVDTSEEQLNETTIS